MVPVAVRQHFLDENAQPARGHTGGVKKGELFPQVSSTSDQLQALLSDSTNVIGPLHSRPSA